MIIHEFSISAQTNNTTLHHLEWLKQNLTKTELVQQQ